jgi:hypothetical protein
MQDKLLDSIDRGVVLRIGINVVSVEVYTVFISSIMATIYSIGIDDWY